MKTIRLWLLVLLAVLLPVRGVVAAAMPCHHAGAGGEQSKVGAAVATDPGHRTKEPAEPLQQHQHQHDGPQDTGHPHEAMHQHAVHEHANHDAEAAGTGSGAHHADAIGQCAS